MWPVWVFVCLYSTCMHGYILWAYVCMYAQYVCIFIWCLPLPLYIQYTSFLLGDLSSASFPFLGQYEAACVGSPVLCR